MALVTPFGGKFGGGSCQECYYTCRAYAVANDKYGCMNACTREYPRCDFEPPADKVIGTGRRFSKTVNASAALSPMIATGSTIPTQLSGIKTGACLGSGQTWKGCFDCLQRINGGTSASSATIDAIRSECDKRYPFTRPKTISVGGAMTQPKTVGMSGTASSVLESAYSEPLLATPIGAAIGYAVGRNTTGIVIGALSGMLVAQIVNRMQAREDANKATELWIECSRGK